MSNEKMFLIPFTTLDKIKHLLGLMAIDTKPHSAIKVSPVLKEDVRKFLPLLELEEYVEPVVQVDPEPLKAAEAKNEAEAAHVCMWAGCEQQATWELPKGFRLCNFHRSQAISAGNVKLGDVT
jgi:hypothetical protein